LTAKEEFKGESNEILRAESCGIYKKINNQFKLQETQDVAVQRVFCLPGGNWSSIDCSRNWSPVDENKRGDLGGSWRPFSSS